MRQNNSVFLPLIVFILLSCSVFASQPSLASSPDATTVHHSFENAADAEETNNCTRTNDASVRANELANFILEHLQNLSFLGVYNKIQLHSIESAEVFEGVYYHTITRLIVNLSSKFFESGKAVEPFKVLVMDSYDDTDKFGQEDRVLAIDEFPKMKQDATDAARRRRLEEHRRLKEQIRNQFQSKDTRDIGV